MTFIHHFRNEFSENNKKAIDEIWYKRAVEQHFIEPNSFVYAVPFDAANRNDTLVTATHAVFHKENTKFAPAAVVGFQFQHSAMITLFKNITSSCSDSSCLNCGSDDFECFVLDDNGYVIVSPDLGDTGRFFGDVRGYLMQYLLAEKIYKSITIYDYQAVCFIGKDSLNFASRLFGIQFWKVRKALVVKALWVQVLMTIFQFQPFKQIWNIIQIMANNVMWLVFSVLLDKTDAYSYYGSESKFG